MSDLASRVDQLARLVEEYGLESASLAGSDWKVAFSRDPEPAAAPGGAAGAAAPRPSPRRVKEKAAPVPAGKPISSPMMGIFYASPSPGSPPFVKVGDSVSAGAVVGLIEAMKVFNEIVSPFSGRVAAAPVESGQLVQPGEALILIE